MIRYSLEEQLAEARREVKLRRRVYGRWVEQNKMDRRLADERIGLMEDIVTSLEGLAQAERLI
jgi:hypothetical protein